MATSAAPGAVGWGPQVDRATAATVYFYHKAREVNLAPIEIVNDFDPEIGGSLLPAGSYKAAYWVGGEIDVVPRLNATLGWLFYCFAGHASSNGDVGAGYTHQFPGRADSGIPQNWMTFRRIIPGYDKDTGAAMFLGEQFEQCKVLSLTLSATPAATLGLRIGVAGLKMAAFVDNPNWIDSYSYEDYSGVPIATKGSFMLPDGTAIDTVTNCQLTLGLGANPRNDLVVGSYTPHDITTLTRDIQVSGTFFWRNPTLYKSLYYNSGGTDWQPEVYSPTGQFHMYFESPGNLATRTYPARIGFRGQKVTWTARPVGLRGGDVISMQLTGRITDAQAGIDWQMYMINDKAAYHWLTPS
jgi:hypothetical protein